MYRGLVVVLALAGCSIGLLIAGCGGSETNETNDAGPVLTLEEYFRQLDEADNIAAARFDQIGEQLTRDEPPEQALMTLKQVYPEEVVTLEDLLQSMERLNAPSEVAFAHEAAVSALRESVDVTQQNAEAIEDAATLQETAAVLNSERTTKADSRLSNTCLALEKEATDRGIAVDLDC